MKPAAPLPFDKLYWTRIGLGAFAGMVATFLFPFDYANGILIGVIFYLASYYVARYLWFRTLERQYLGKIYSTGIGGYAGIFLITWIMLFTLFLA